MLNGIQLLHWVGQETLAQVPLFVSNNDNGSSGENDIDDDKSDAGI